MMNIEVNGTNIQVKLYDNSSAEAELKKVLGKGNITATLTLTDEGLVKE